MRALNTEPGAVATALNLHQEQEANKTNVSPLRVGAEMLIDMSFLEESCYLSAVAIAPGSVLARCAASVALQT